MYTLILSTLLIGAYASPLPLPQPESPFSPLTLQTAVHESLAKPKQWHTSTSTPELELETEFANENLEPKIKSTTTTTADPHSPSEAVEMTSWDSRLGDNFRSFMAAVKEKHETIIVEEPTSPEDLTSPSEIANQATKRSVIPKKPKKEPTPEPEPAPAPAPEAEAEAEAEAEEQPEELELTNEEFDALFAEYASKHDTHNFNSLQTYLDNLLKPTSQPYTIKPWQQRQKPTISRRDGSSSNQRFSPDRKPPISISPEVFNRIAADYKFTQNPTAINVEDGFLGRSAANGKGSGGGGVPVSLATQTAGARGKAGLKGGLEKRRVGSPCDVLVVGDRIQGHGCDSVVSFFEAMDVFEGRYN